MEQTLIIFKPDAVQRGLVGEILARFEKRGIKVAGLKMIRMDKELAEKHYAEHKGKGFFPGLIGYITSSPVIVGVLQADNVIGIVRKMTGATNPVDADPGTIRDDYALHTSLNIIHASDSLKSAKREIELFFDESEILDYERIDAEWV